MECDRFRDDVEALLHGAVRISTVFDDVDLLYGACAPDAVTFFGGESTGVNGVDIVAWEWKLGSQVVSDQPSFSASFFTAGSVTATLTVRDANGQILSGSKTLYFGSPFIHVKDMDRGSMAVTFRTHTSPLIANYTWNFGEGSQSVSGPNLSQVSHQFPALGKYTVRTVQGNDLTKTYELNFDPTPTDVYGTIEHSQVWGPAGSPTASGASSRSRRAFGSRCCPAPWCKAGPTAPTRGGWMYMESWFRRASSLPPSVCTSPPLAICRRPRWEGATKGRLATGKASASTLARSPRLRAPRFATLLREWAARLP
ncbi:MAG: PKD domain-containing protein [Fimbriimonadia bacterium]